MNIYFCGSMTSGRDDIVFYKELISYLQTYGTVLNKEVGDIFFDFAKEDEELGQKAVYDKYIQRHDQADCFVAEVTVTSLGVGYELGRAVAMKKPVLCLWRPKEKKKISSMIAGCSTIVMRPYNSIDEAKKHITSFFGIFKKILKKYFKEKIKM